MTIRDNFPSIEPSLVLDFVNSGYIDPRITFSRSDATSCATYFDRSGILRVAPANFPRIDYDPVTLACRGLLIEPTRTNLLTYSEAFDVAWGLTNASVTANTSVAPNNTITADTISDNGTTPARVGQSVTVTSGAIYTASIYLKAGTQSTVFWREDNEDALGVGVNLSTGTVTSGTGTVEAVGNGWYHVTFSGSVAGTSFRPEIRMVSAGTVLAWGAQLEAGAFPTSYISTTTDPVTRAYDFARVSDLAPWYNQSEGTLYLEASYSGELYGTAFSTNVVQLDDGTGNNYITMRVVRDPSNPYLDEILRTSNVAQVDTVGIQPIAAGNIYKRVFAYATNNSRGAINGVYTATAPDTNCAIPTALTRLNFTTDTLRQCMHIRKFAYYPIRHPDAQLLSLTSS